MKTTSSIAFYCRNCKKDRNGYAPLEMSISLAGDRKFLHLPQKYRPEEFNKKRPSKEITATCDAWRQRVNAYIGEMVQQGIPVTTASLKQIVQTGGVRSYLVKDLFRDYLTTMRKRISNPATYRKEEHIQELFFEYYDKEKEVTTITPAVAEDFYYWLQQRYNSTTSASYINKFKRVCRYALDNGYLKINPVQNIRVKRHRKAIDYLTDEELEKIRTADISNDSLNAVRDAFLLQCYSGLSYIDLEHLQREDIQQQGEVNFITKPRVKSGITYTAVILPEAKEILERNNYKMKVISNQKMNLYLKQVATLAGVDHNLTTHLGRKTYGHILLNDKKIRIDTVARCLGHSNSRTTARYYAEVVEDTVLQEVAATL